MSGWFSVLESGMSDLVKKAVQAGMPAPLAETLYKSVLERSIGDSVEVRFRNSKN